MLAAYAWRLHRCDFVQCCSDGEKVAEHRGERSEAAILKFIAANSRTEHRERHQSRSSEL